MEKEVFLGMSYDPDIVNRTDSLGSSEVER